MRRGGAKKRRDANEPVIIQALRQAGADVWQLNDPGVGDLLVRFRGVLHCAEVKTGSGTLTKLQGQFPIWRCPFDALVAIGAVTAEDADATQLP
jgi:hypothetical protein